MDVRKNAAFSGERAAGAFVGMLSTPERVCGRSLEDLSLPHFDADSISTTQPERPSLQQQPLELRRLFQQCSRQNLTALRRHPSVHAWWRKEAQLMTRPQFDLGCGPDLRQKAKGPLSSWTSSDWDLNKVHRSVFFGLQYGAWTVLDCAFSRGIQ